MVGERVVIGLEFSIRIEVEVLKQVVEVIVMFSYNKIMFEFDFMILVKMINEIEEVWLMLYLLIDVICWFFLYIQDYEEKYYLRGRNKIVDKIVNEIIIFVFNVFKLYFVLLKWLKFQVEYDKMLYRE